MTKAMAIGDRVKDKVNRWSVFSDVVSSSKRPELNTASAETRTVPECRESLCGTRPTEASRLWKVGVLPSLRWLGRHQT